MRLRWIIVVGFKVTQNLGLGSKLWYAMMGWVSQHIYSILFLMNFIKVFDSRYNGFTTDELFFVRSLVSTLSAAAYI